MGTFTIFGLKYNERVGREMEIVSLKGMNQYFASKIHFYKDNQTIPDFLPDVCPVRNTVTYSFEYW